MIYFDTLQYVKTLESSGVSQKQAEAMARAQQNVLSECLNTTLATKEDIRVLRSDVEKDISALENKLMSEISPMKADITTLKSDVKWIQWALSFVGAGVGTLILKAFF